MYKPLIQYVELVLRIRIPMLYPSRAGSVSLLIPAPGIPISKAVDSFFEEGCIRIRISNKPVGFGSGFQATGRIRISKNRSDSDPHFKKQVGLGFQKTVRTRIRISRNGSDSDPDFKNSADPDHVWKLTFKHLKSNFSLEVYGSKKLLNYYILTFIEYSYRLTLFL